MILVCFAMFVALVLALISARRFDVAKLAAQAFPQNLPDP